MQVIEAAKDAKRGIRAHGLGHPLLYTSHGDGAIAVFGKLQPRIRLENGLEDTVVGTGLRDRKHRKLGVSEEACFFTVRFCSC